MKLPDFTVIEISHEGYISGGLISLGSLSKIVVIMATQNSFESQLVYSYTNKFRE